MPLISVITGAYNISQYFALDTSLNSILKQTFDDFEFIICDDGSQDDTWDILNRYAAKDSRIKLLRNEKNCGLAASLNRCIDVSLGRYIARHDLDDYCDTARFCKQLEYLRTHENICVLGCQSYLFNRKGIWGKEEFPFQITNRDFLFRSPYMHGSVMFRREALLAVGCYRVSKETYRAEDYDLFMALQQICTGANLNEYLYYYCEDDNTRKRRKYKYRIDEARVRLAGFRKLGLMPSAFPYVIKPLIVGVIPSLLLEAIKDKYYNRRR